MTQDITPHAPVTADVDTLRAWLEAPAGRYYPGETNADRAGFHPETFNSSYYNDGFTLGCIDWLLTGAPALTITDPAIRNVRLVSTHVDGHCSGAYVHVTMGNGLVLASSHLQADDLYTLGGNANDIAVAAATAVARIVCEMVSHYRKAVGTATAVTGP